MPRARASMLDLAAGAAALMELAEEEGDPYYLAALFLCEHAERRKAAQDRAKQGHQAWRRQFVTFRVEARTWHRILRILPDPTSIRAALIRLQEEMGPDSAYPRFDLTTDPIVVSWIGDSTSRRIQHWTLRRFDGARSR